MEFSPKRLVAVISLILSLLVSGNVLRCQTTCLEVITHQKISDTRGYFTGILDNSDKFGAPALLGDVNGDGVGDIAVGASGDDDGGADRGAIWIVYLDIYGRSLFHQKISYTQGGFLDTLDNGDGFGASVVAIGDVNNDGINDLAVGAPNDDDGGGDRGAIWILMLDTNSTVKSRQKISHTHGGFSPQLRNGDNFGSDVSMVGDMNGDGHVDVGVSSPGDDDGGTDRGAVWILFLDSLGKSIGNQKISDTMGNFNGGLHNSDNFGNLCGGFDLNSDGNPDLAVGAPGDDDGGLDRGAVWILFLDSNSFVSSFQKISDTAGFFTGVLQNGDGFGGHIRVDDVDGNGLVDLVIGSKGCDHGGSDRGAFWILYITTTGKVGFHFQFSDIERNFVGVLDNNDRFGSSVAAMGDFNNDGFYDIAVGAPLDDDGGGDRGAIWLISVAACSTGCTAAIFEDKRFISFPAPGTQRAHSIIHSRDSTLVLCGTTNSFGAGGLDWFVMKIKPDGDIIWSKTFGSSSDETGNSIILKQTHDDGYLLVGRTYGFATSGGGIYMLKLSSNGNILWQKKADGSSNEHARALELTQDKGFIISGSNGYILKFDSTGTMQWNRYYSGGGNMHFVSVREIAERKEYLVVGEVTSYGAGGRTGYVVCLDSAGSKKWERIYDNTFEDRLCASVRTSDKGFIIVGSTELGNPVNPRRCLIIKVDSVGKLIWSRHYSSGTSHDWGLKIIKASSSGYLVTGYSEGSLTNRNTLMRVDDYGNTQWARSFIGNSNDIETYFGETIDNASDGGYYFFGYMPGQSSVYDIYVSKINSCGEAACNDGQILIVYEDRDLNISDPASSITTWGTISNITSTVGTFNVQDTLVCEDIPICQLVAGFSADSVCEGDTTQFLDLSYDSLSNVTGWRWYFGDGDSAINVQNPSHLYADSGTYTVTLVIFNTDTINCIDTIEKNVIVAAYPVVDLGNDSTVCQGDTLSLDATFPGATYLWSNLSTLPILKAGNSGTYYVEVDNMSCKASDTITISHDSIPFVNIGSDTLICDEDTFTLNAVFPGATYRWHDSSTTPTYLVAMGGNFWVEVTSGACLVTDSILVGVDPLTTANLGPDSTICDGQQILLSSASPGATYLWNDLSTGSTLLINDSGQYWVRVTSQTGICYSSDTIMISLEVSPIIDIGPDTTFCQNDSVYLSVSYPGATYLWSTSSVDSFIIVYSPGNYQVTAVFGNCSSTDEILLAMDSLPNVELGDNAGICEDDSFLLSLSDKYDSYLWSNFDTSHRSVFYNEGIIWVLVRWRDCENSDSILLDVNPLPYPALPDSFYICEEKELILDAGNYGAFYDWSTGESTQEIAVSDTGLYTVLILNYALCELSDTTHVWGCSKDIFIPNTITPNGDGSNDAWFIRNIQFYPGNTVEIFNRDGYLLFSIQDYKNDWNGTFKGEELPETVYFYVVDLANGANPYKGTITIIRE